MPTKEELIESILENIDLSFTQAEDEQEEVDESDDDDESEDSPELSPEDIEEMDISMLLDSVSPDVFISLINDELGNGALSGTMNRDGKVLRLRLTYFDDSSEEEDVVLNDERDSEVEDFDGLLDFLNEALDALVENLESDEGMVVL